ncbi:hypothetical protein MPSEU_000962400 [Mayamaea pseudoterrestris]|nr:hypothetical protein MPSEU_000962400 [Mayamaea pseudoterrestris]
MFQREGLTLLPTQQPLNAAAATTTTTTTTVTPTPPKASFSETALQWIQRTKRRRFISGEINDPDAAAWAFFSRKETGISFVNAALHAKQQGAESVLTANEGTFSNNMHATAASNAFIFDQLPVIEIRGSCAATWTLLTLAARFVVDTRPSRFISAAAAAAAISANKHEKLPQVIFMDSTYEYSIAQLTNVVRSTLLKQQTHQSVEEEQLAHDLRECLSRIHLASLTESYEAVALLELFRTALAPSQFNHPTLVLWDGFLDTINNQPSRMDVVRQTSRLLRDCSVVFASASRLSRSQHDWDKYVTHRMKLDRNPSEEGHEYLASVHDGSIKIPFSVSLAGILS